MSMPYDASLKDIITRYAQDWATYLGFPDDVTLTVIDSELSTISAAADRIIVAGEPFACALDLEMQASHDPWIE